MQLTDILTVVQSGKVVWPTFLQRVQTAATQSYVLAALTLGQKLIGVPVPDEILQKLAEATSTALRQRIATLDLAYVLRRTQQKPLVSLGQRLQHGFKDRAEIARWSPTLAGKLRVWQTAVQFTRTDTAQLLRK